MKSRKPYSVQQATISPDEPVTWAGRGRVQGEICLGYESGRIQFFDISFKPITAKSPVLGSGEPINGAIFLGSLSVVTTRDEVISFQVSGNKIKASSFPSGAYGVVAGRSDTIVAPMGHDGLLCIQRQPDHNYRVGKVCFEGSDEPYHYQTAYLGTDELGQDVFASACRSEGLTLTPIGPNNTIGTSANLRRPAIPSEDSRDVVGVCSLNLSKYPYGVAMVTMDKSIHFSLDARTGEFTTSVAEDLQGTPYSISIAQNHVFMLTSDCFYAIQNHATKPLRASEGNRSTLVASRKVDAVDMMLVDNRYVLLVLENEVISIDSVDLFQELSLRNNSFQSPTRMANRFGIRRVENRDPSRGKTVDSRFAATSISNRKLESIPLVFA